jgi:putative addiction module component (TIGR02574 family)
MSLGAKDVLEAALKLNPEERERLADALRDSLEHGDDDSSVERAWEEEIERRCKEVDDGRAEIVAWDDVKAEIAKRLRER